MSEEDFPKLKSYDGTTLTIRSVEEEMLFITNQYDDRVVLSYKKDRSAIVSGVMRCYKIDLEIVGTPLLKNTNEGKKNTLRRVYYLIDFKLEKKYYDNKYDGKYIFEGEYLKLKKKEFVQAIEKMGDNCHLDENLMIHSFEWGNSMRGNIYLFQNNQNDFPLCWVCENIFVDVGQAEVSTIQQNRLLNRWKEEHLKEVTKLRSRKHVDLKLDSVRWSTLKPIDPKEDAINSLDDDTKRLKNKISYSLREDGEFHDAAYIFLNKNPSKEIELEVVVGIKNCGKYVIYGSSSYSFNGVPDFGTYHPLKKVNVNTTLRTTDNLLGVKSPHEVLIFKVTGEVPYDSILFMCSSDQFNFCNPVGFKNHNSEIDEITRKNNFPGGDKKDENFMNDEDPVLKTVYVQKPFEVSMREYFSNEECSNDFVKSLVNLKKRKNKFNVVFSKFYEGPENIDLGSYKWTDEESDCPILEVVCKIIVCGDWYSRKDFGFYLRSIRLAVVGDGKLMDNWMIVFVSKKEFSLEEAKKELVGVVKYMEHAYSNIDLNERIPSLMGRKNVDFRFKCDGLLFKSDLKEYWEICHQGYGYEKRFSMSSLTPMVLKYLYNWKQDPKSMKKKVEDMELSPDKYYLTFHLVYFILNQKFPGYNGVVPDLYGKKPSDWNIEKNLYPFIPLNYYLMETFHPSLMYARFLLPVLWIYVICLITFYAFSTEKERSDEREFFFNKIKECNIVKECWKIKDVFGYFDLDMRNDLNGGQFLRLLELLCEKNSSIWKRLEELLGKMNNQDLKEAVGEFLKLFREFCVDLKYVVDKESGTVDPGELFDFVKNEEDVHLFIDVVSGIFLNTCYLYSVVKKDVLLKQLLIFSGLMHLFHMRVVELINHKHFKIAHKQRPPPVPPAKEGISTMTNINDGEKVRMDGQGESMNKMTFKYLKILMNEDLPFLQINEETKKKIEEKITIEEEENVKMEDITYHERKIKEEELNLSRTVYKQKKKEYIERMIKELESRNFDFYEHVPPNLYSKYFDPIMKKRKKIFEVVKKIHILSADFRNSTKLDELTWKKKFSLEFESETVNNNIHSILKDYQKKMLYRLLNDVKKILGKEMEDDSDDDSNENTMDGVNKEKNNGKFVIMDCGLGKTLTFLLFLSILLQNQIFTHCVIVTPSGLIPQLVAQRDKWEKAFRGRFPQFYFFLGDHSRQKKKENVTEWVEKGGCLVISYDSFPNLFSRDTDYPKLMRMVHKCLDENEVILILDEVGDKFNNPKTSKTDCIIQMCPLFRYIAGFTAYISDGKLPSFVNISKVIGVKINLKAIIRYDELKKKVYDIPEFLYLKSRAFCFRIKEQIQLPFETNEFIIFTKTPRITRKVLELFNLGGTVGSLGDVSIPLSDYKYQSRIKSINTSALLFSMNDSFIKFRNKNRKKSIHINNITRLFQEESVESVYDKKDKKERKKMKDEEEEESEEEVEGEGPDDSDKMKISNSEGRFSRRKNKFISENKMNDEDEINEEEKKKVKFVFREIIEELKEKLLFIPKLDKQFRFIQMLKNTNKKGILFMESGDVDSFISLFKHRVYKIAIKDKYKIGISDIVSITQKETMLQRNSRIRRFETNSIRCIVTTFRVGGLGNDVPFASEVCLSEFDINPSVTEQAKKRVKRINQKSSSVNIYKLITEDGFDLKKLMRYMFHERKYYNMRALNSGIKINEYGLKKGILEIRNEARESDNVFIKSLSYCPYPVTFLDLKELTEKNEEAIKLKRKV